MAASTPTPPPTPRSGGGAALPCHGACQGHCPSCQAKALEAARAAQERAAS